VLAVLRSSSGNVRALRIEDAAARLFAEQGYAPTLLDEIAAAAGVTKPVLYRHFDSKQALYLALLRKHATRRIRTTSGAQRDLSTALCVSRSGLRWVVSVLNSRATLSGTRYHCPCSNRSRLTP
jgi:AcrR family transcriptional regulator